MVYAVLADVQARLPWFTISDSTSPSDTEVEAWIEEASDVMSAVLQACQIEYEHASTTQAYRILRQHVVSFVAGRVRHAIAATGLEEATDGLEEVDRWDNLLSSIKRDPAYFSAMLGLGSSSIKSRRARSLVVDESDRTDLDPMFSKDMDF